MVKKAIILIFIILNFTFIYSQTLSEKKSEIEKLFKNSILQKNKSKINIGANSWKICIENSNSEIYLYEKQFEKYSDCCKYINWTFYKKNKFIKNISNLCSEPPLSTVTTGDDWYKIEYTFESKKLILKIISENKTEKFIVENIEKMQNKLHRIHLIRIE